MQRLILKLISTAIKLGSGAALNDPNGQWEPPKLDLDGELKYLIDREINRRGMTLVKPENADVVVAFFVAVNMAADQYSAQMSQMHNEYNRAYAVCLEGRGYNVK